MIAVADFNPLCDKLLSQILSFSDSKITLFSRNFMMKVCMMSYIARVVMEVRRWMIIYLKVSGLLLYNCLQSQFQPFNPALFSCLVLWIFPFQGRWIERTSFDLNHKLLARKPRAKHNWVSVDLSARKRATFKQLDSVHFAKSNNFSWMSGFSRFCIIQILQIQFQTREEVNKNHFIVCLNRESMVLKVNNTKAVDAIGSFSTCSWWMLS